jgi:hypothetical protein
MEWGRFDRKEEGLKWQRMDRNRTGLGKEGEWVWTEAQGVWG